MSSGYSLFETIFERKLTAGDTRDYLEQITRDHPFFSPAQFYLLLKTNSDSPAYPRLAARTNVHFNNAYWLQFQLQEELEAMEQPVEISEEPLEASEVPLVGDVAPVADSGAGPDISTGDTDIEKAKAGQDEIVTTISEEQIADEEAVPVDAGSISENNPVEQVDEVEPALPDASFSPVVAADDLQVEENEAEVATNHDDDIAVSGDEIIPVEKEEKSGHEHENTIDSVEGDGEIADTPHSVHFNNQSTPLVNEGEKEEEIPGEAETAPLHFKLNLDTPATTEDTITFEPLHTSDYFASLGIKLSNEVKPNDKLGKQLKSFTEWLKTMKKVHNDQLPPLSGQADQSIQQLAEQSNKENAVLTEAMADVLLKQGKVEKAIEVYEKLSLLNPAKSTYFAAKIEQLKEH